jgi:hypothetical protein
MPKVSIRRAEVSLRPESPRSPRDRHAFAVQLAAALLSFLSIGCAPAVKFLQTEAKPNVEEGKIKSVSFLAAFRADNLTDEQVVYKVRVLNRRNEPLRSGNGTYRDTEGDVAASKTYMIGPSPFVVPDAQVTIPARELEVRRGDLPISAEFIVFDAAGKELAKTTGPIPVRSAGSRSTPRQADETDASRTSREPPPPEKGREPFNPWTARRSYNGEPPPAAVPGGPGDPDVPQPRSASRPPPDSGARDPDVPLPRSAAGARDAAAAPKPKSPPAPPADPHAD